MSKSDYLAKDDEGKAAQFERFRDTIGTFYVALGLTAGEVEDQAEDATWFRYILNHSVSMKDSASQWVAYKNALLNGTGGAVTPITPTPPVPAPTSVALGIAERFRALVRRIKVAPNYLDSIGEALGIIGTDHVTRDISTLMPEISLRLNGGKVDVLWNKDGQEAVEIQVDRGNGIWTFLAIDTRPDYTDTEPFPATAAKWKYRATYTQDAQRIGQWSNVAEITVGG